ncbi:MAG: hypothetical protein K2N41_04615 [Lachnospiraceae bacterium]|nr:hypothetical protein [Lachnospiraceae bacterium]MDE7238977.1 hypothetical protein [Lachnospiraceae bacterium]
MVNESAANILDRTAKSPNRVRPVTEYERVRWAAGKAVTGKEDEENAIAAWRNCFLRFGNGGNNGSLLAESMNDILLRYASGDSRDQKLLD